MSEMVPMYGFGGGISAGKIVTVHVTPGTGANVTCTNGKKTFTGTTDENGDAIFKLAKGPWTITAEKSGASVTQNVAVVEDCTVNIDLNQIPVFTYTGTYKIVDDNDNAITTSADHWKIRFLTSGTLAFTDLKGAENGIDVFLVGGGGNGGSQNSNGGHESGSGGGGGYTKTVKGLSVTTADTYSIIVGGSAGNTSAFGYTANAGRNGAHESAGGAGGSGGGGSSIWNGPGMNGGSDGSNGSTASYGNTTYSGGAGQGSTTREFGESTGNLYSGGGGSGSGGGTPNLSSGKGGAGGGGNGGIFSGTPVKAQNGYANTGGGGGGAARETSRGSGGSGIVIIRNKR